MDLHMKVNLLTIKEKFNYVNNIVCSIKFTMMCILKGVNVYWVDKFIKNT